MTRFILSLAYKVEYTIKVGSVEKKNKSWGNLWLDRFIVETIVCIIATHTAIDQG